MNYKEFCVQADNYEEALRKWRNGETVAKEEKSKKEGFDVKVEGNKVIVTLGDGRVGEARCHPDDKFDILEGVKVALADIESKTEHFSDKEIKILQFLKSMGCDEVVKERITMGFKSYFLAMVGLCSDEAETSVIVDEGDFEDFEEDDIYNIDEKLKYVR